MFKGRVENVKELVTVEQKSEDELKPICTVKKKKSLYDCTVSQRCRQKCFLVIDQKKTSGPEPQNNQHNIQTPGRSQNWKDQMAVHKEKQVKFVSKV